MDGFSFSTLVVELLKLQQKLTTLNMAMEVNWNTNYHLDVINLVTTFNLKKYEFLFMRCSWDERREFTIRENGLPLVFRLDSLTGQPIYLQKPGVADQPQSEDLVKFGSYVVSILSEVLRNLKLADNQYMNDRSVKLL
jgi:hypothetical protein